MYAVVVKLPLRQSYINRSYLTPVLMVQLFPCSQFVKCKKNFEQAIHCLLYAVASYRTSFGQLRLLFIVQALNFKMNGNEKENVRSFTT